MLFIEKINSDLYCCVIFPDSCFFLNKKQIEKNIKSKKIICFGDLDLDNLLIYDLKILYNFSGHKVNNIIELCESMNINCGLYRDAKINIDFSECKNNIQKEKAIIKSCTIAKIDIGKFGFQNLFIDKEFLPKLYKSKALICQRLFERLNEKLLSEYENNYFKLKDCWRKRDLQHNKAVTPFIDGKKEIQQELI